MDSDAISGGTTSCSTPTDTDYDPTTRTCGGGTSTVYQTIKDGLSSSALSDGDTLILMPGTHTLPTAADITIAVGSAGSITVRSYQNNAA